MALNNCTINSAAVNVTKGQALGSGVANQVLTITPNTGYVVAAADFADNSGTITGINDIALTNSGTAYADDNKVPLQNLTDGFLSSTDRRNQKTLNDLYLPIITGVLGDIPVNNTSIEVQFNEPIFSKNDGR